MTAIATQPASQHAYLTKSAERQLESLPSTKQRAVCRALAEPVQAWRVEKLCGFRSSDVWRLRIAGDGALRAVYRVVNSACYVVFVGEHRQYERFLRAWRGRVCGQVIPVGESEVVTKILNPQSTPNGASTAIARQTTNDRVVVHAEPAAATSPTDMLWQGMQSLVREAVDQELNSSLETVAQLGREELERELQTQSTLLEQQGQAVVGLRDTIEQRGQGAERALSVLRDSFEGLADAAGIEFSELKELFRTLGQRQAAGVDALDKKLVAATKVVCQRMEERYRSTLECLAGITTQSDRLVDLLAGCQEQFVATASKQQASEELLLAAIEGQVTELRQWREEWQRQQERRTSWGRWWPLLTAWARVQSRRGRSWWERLTQTRLIRSSK